MYAVPNVVGRGSALSFRPEEDLRPEVLAVASEARRTDGPVVSEERGGIDRRAATAAATLPEGHEFIAMDWLGKLGYIKEKLKSEDASMREVAVTLLQVYVADTDILKLPYGLRNSSHLVLRKEDRCLWRSLRVACKSSCLDLKIKSVVLLFRALCNEVRYVYRWETLHKYITRCASDENVEVRKAVQDALAECFRGKFSKVPKFSELKIILMIGAKDADSGVSGAANVAMDALVDYLSTTSLMQTDDIKVAMTCGGLSVARKTQFYSLIESRANDEEWATCAIAYGLLSYYIIKFSDFIDECEKAKIFELIQQGESNSERLTRLEASKTGGIAARWLGVGAV